MGTKFGNKGGASAASKPKGRFAGVDPGSGTGKPLLPLGTHVLKVLETRRSQVKSDTFFADVEILETDNTDARVGNIHQYLQSMTDSFGYGAAAVTRFVIACGDLDDEGVETLLAEANEERSVVDAACGVETEYGENPLKDCKVRVHVQRGKDDGKGGFYRDCTWSPVEG